MCKLRLPGYVMLKGYIQRLHFRSFSSCLPRDICFCPTHRKRRSGCYKKHIHVPWSLVLTCHVNSKWSVSPPARIPADDFAVFHHGALVPPSSHQSHGPHRHFAGRTHLQEAGKAWLWACLFPSKLFCKCRLSTNVLIINTRYLRGILAYRCQPNRTLGSCTGPLIFCEICSSPASRHLLSTGSSYSVSIWFKLFLK